MAALTKRTVKLGKSLAEVNPELASEWNFALNGELTPLDVTASSGKKVWWSCRAYQHEWNATINDRSNGRGCPVCSGRVILVGFNDLGTINPELASEWNFALNGELTPSQVTISSGKKVWWSCRAHQHEWETTIASRSSGTGCPFCSGRKPIPGVNDLFTMNPRLVTEWHSTLNFELTPLDVKRSSNKKIWWSCHDHQHEWQALVSHRSSGNGCPFCYNRKILVGFNDLGTTDPLLAAEWHPTLNGALTPLGVIKGSQKKVGWSCRDYQHEWEATISSRSRGNGCPVCATGITERTFREHFTEISGLNFTSERIQLIRNSRKTNLAQIDMLNDSAKLAIEYDGAWTHGANGPENKTLAQKLDDDKETTQTLVDAGYKVIRIRDHDSREKLPFVPVDPSYENNVFQITYRSRGKQKDSIEDIVRKVIAEKVDWFKPQA